MTAPGLATRPLGDTGMEVTPMGLGLAALGRPGYINLGHGTDMGGGTDVAAMGRHCHGVCEAAWAAGIRYFDVARSYGRAEEFLAAWLAATGRRPVVASKWGYEYTAGWQVNAEVHEVKRHSRQQFDRQWAESRALLGDHLDIYQIHSATLDSGVLDTPAVLEGLAGLREQGVRVGLSLSGPRQGETLERAMAVTVDGRRLFDTVQATWNLLEPGAGPALAAAREMGMGVIIKEAVANGRLTARNPGPEIAPLRAAAQRTGHAMDTLALAAVLARPWVDVVLSGAATVTQVASNRAALDVEWPPELEALTRPMTESSQAYWTTRNALHWN